MVVKRSTRAGLLASAFVGTWAFAAHAADVPAFYEATTLIRETCGTCHTDEGDGKFSRISHMRKTPEGWDMTIGRMIDWHGLKISPTHRERIVKHLADTQGLAPAETAAYRWSLERRPNVVRPAADETEQAMCGRCHTLARPALQRRDADQWLKLVHTHLGEFPTTEYQAQSRDRRWWEIASQEMPQALASRYGLQSDAWDSWRDKAINPADLSGAWSLSGTRPGKGPYVGTMEVERGAKDAYTTRWTIRYLRNGETAEASGDVRLFTGYEWRGTSRLGESTVREVYAVSEDGRSLTGRWFHAEADELGGSMTAVRADGPATVLHVEPAVIKPGTTTRVTLHGAGLGKGLAFGPGVNVANVEHAPDGSWVAADVTTSVDTPAGALAVKAGKAEAVLAVAADIDRATVEPPFAIARLGGGSTPPVVAQFELVGWLNGPDGKPETDDDIRVGSLPATWSVDNFDDVAKEMKDTHFAGRMQHNGLFVPAATGPNPQRPFSGNNAGNLSVTGTAEFNGKPVEAQGHLIVTVQKWIKRAIE